MRRSLLPFFSLVAVAILFFYQSIFFGKIPFPGDMLISQYVPWKYESVLGFNPGSYPNKAQYFDVVQQLFPWRQLVVEQILGGKVPLWNPYNFSGSPLLANSQSAVFNPVNIFFFLFSVPVAWTITIFLQCLLASIFTYLFARKISLLVLPSLISAIGYSYSLFMTVFLEYNTLGYVLALLPAALYLFELRREKKTFWRTVFFVLSITLLFFVGHLQSAAVSFIFIFFYAFSRRNSSSTKRDFPYEITFLMLLSLIVASIQLLPTIELISISARVSQEYRFLVEKLLIQPWQLIMLVIPDIFGNPVTRNFIPNETYPTKSLSIGVITLFFAFTGIMQAKELKQTRFFIGSLVIIFLLITRNPFSEFFYHFNLPLFSTSSPSNMIFLSSFCFSILAGFGIQSWIGGKVSKKYILYFISFVLILSALAFGQRGFFQEKNIAFSLFFVIAVCSIVLIGSFKNNWRSIFACCCMLLVIGESFFFFQKFNPFVPKELLYPTTKIATKLHSLTLSGERVWSFGNAAIESNVQTALHLYSPEGYDPLYPAQYGELLYATRDGKLPVSFDASTRSNAMVASESDGGVSLIKNQARLRILNLLSVRYIVDRAENASSEKTFPVKTFKRIYNAGGWSIYENKDALPNAWLATSAVVNKSSEGFQKTFFNSTFEEGKTAILSDTVGEKLTMKRGAVTQFLSLNDRMLYKTQSDGSSILVLSKIYYPGWEGYVDGRPGRILRVDHALSGIFVPAGEHDVTLYYWPRSFVFGMYLSIIGIVFVVAYAGFIQKRFSKN